MERSPISVSLPKTRFGRVQTDKKSLSGMDAREKYLFTAHGSRGWLENGKEEVSTFEINA